MFVVSGTSASSASGGTTLPIAEKHCSSAPTTRSSHVSRICSVTLEGRKCVPGYCKLQTAHECEELSMNKQSLDHVTFTCNTHTDHLKYCPGTVYIRLFHCIFTAIKLLQSASAFLVLHSFVWIFCVCSMSQVLILQCQTELFFYTASEEFWRFMKNDATMVLQQLSSHFR